MWSHLSFCLLSLIAVFEPLGGVLIGTGDTTDLKPALFVVSCGEGHLDLRTADKVHTWYYSVYSTVHLLHCTLSTVHLPYCIHLSTTLHLLHCTWYSTFTTLYSVQYIYYTTYIYLLHYIHLSTTLYIYYTVPGMVPPCNLPYVIHLHAWMCSANVL